MGFNLILTALSLIASITVLQPQARALEPICGTFNFNKSQVKQILNEIESRKDLRIPNRERAAKREIFQERRKSPLKFIEHLNQDRNGDHVQSLMEEVHEAVIEKGRKFGNYDISNFRLDDLEKADVVRGRQIAKYILYTEATRPNNWEKLSASIFNDWGANSLQEFKYYMASKVQDELLYSPKKNKDNAKFYFAFPDTDYVFVKIDRKNIGEGNFCLGVRNIKNSLIPGAEKIHSEEETTSSSAASTPNEADE
jgi:hypothetical protein